MTIIEPSVTIEDFDSVKVLQNIERAGRTCYKSEANITKDSSEAFVASIIKRGHESVLEHEKITFRVICDRGVSHEIVRHRLASYSQESTRYVNYNKKGMEFIKPNFWNNDEDLDDYRYCMWQNMMKMCEEAYNRMIESGAKPEEARSVLPNSLKTEIVCTMNLRELRHFLKLRTAKVAHPQMRQVASMLYNLVKTKLPCILEDIIIEKTA